MDCIRNDVARHATFILHFKTVANNCVGVGGVDRSLAPFMEEGKVQ